MVLSKHKIEGIEQIQTATLPSDEFDQLLRNAGYEIAGTAPAQGGRYKVWWIHPDYGRVESIYSADKLTAITAYPVA
jgi:hypothetical protein